MNRLCGVGLLHPVVLDRNGLVLDGARGDADGVPPFAP